jgi:hypothetical protein
MGMDMHMVETPEVASGYDGYYRFRTPAMRAMSALMERAGVFEGGAVDPEKFRWNDGQLVSPDECRHIADVLERFLTRLTAADVAHVEEVWSAAEAELMSRFGGGDMVFLEPASTSVRLEAGELAELIRGWAEYNRVAAAHGGYRVS